jgi:hypothetical protein
LDHMAQKLVSYITWKVDFPLLIETSAYAMTAHEDGYRVSCKTVN